MLRQKLHRLAAALMPAALRDSLAREQDLQQQVRLLRTALDHTSHGIQMIDRDGRVVVINRHALELLELPAALMATTPLLRDVLALQRKAGDLDGLPAEVLAEIDAGRDLIQTETVYHRRRRDGRLLEVQNVPLPGGGAVRTHTDITLREAANAKIAFMARHDSLTGLGNRQLFTDQLGTALQAGAGVALLCLDLDRFKQVNDTLGHPVGDALLRSVARRLLATARPGDTVARLGGDEFAVIHAPLLTVGETEVLAEALVDALAQPFEVEGHDIAIAASVGIAFALPGAGQAMDQGTLLRQADLALYDAKDDGRGVFRRFDPGMEASALERHALERELRRALSEDKFELYYQPQVDVRTAALGGFEALLRWRHPQRGIVSAGQLIPLAESTGLIGQLGTWVLNRACADAAIWPPQVRVSVNLSPMQFRSPVLVPLVAAALARHGLPPARLELEVTESLLLRDMAATEATLGALRGLGVGIALDNFGTGYASLSYLRRFLFDRLKIDQSFISGVGDRGDADAVVRAVIGLAGSLGLPTVAEGVERPSQLSWLRREGCDLAQGFLFSRARPARDVPAMLVEHRGVLAAGV